MKDPHATPIRYLKGIGPRKAEYFHKRGIVSVEDLLYHFPRRYEDRTHFSPIAELKEGGVYTVRGSVLVEGSRSSWRRAAFKITEVLIADDSGRITATWFNQPYLRQYFKAGSQVILYGKVQQYGGRLQFVAPEFELLASPGRGDSPEQGPLLDADRIVPVYQVPERVSQRTMRKLVFRVLDEYLPASIDPLAYDIRSRHGLMNLAQALRAIHFPETPEQQTQAYDRLCFEEFFIFQVPLAVRKLLKKRKQGIAHTAPGAMLAAFIKSLPFELTRDQEQVLSEIAADMQDAHVMQRLLQGDVGSGKTVVATAAALIAVEGGYQAAFMVPTEILARQHYEKISQQLDTAVGARHAVPLRGVRCGLLSAGLTEKARSALCRDIREGRTDLVIGTHALLEQDVQFKRLGLVVIDEQHKFGVGQRALLPQKGVNPDVLIMTATPIPRTLAITLYGDLDISVIRSLPPGRQPIETIHLEGARKEQAYALARRHLEQGNQVYFIYPVIEESAALDIAGAEKMFRGLSVTYFKKYRLGLIHGKMSRQEQEAVMDAFRTGAIQLLVATTILEVGIDIPSVTCMVIEHAERFGLSQLHQLRGRIGRGSQPSLCILISDAPTEESVRRMEAMRRYSDGFRIAQEDLKIRGPGEFFGRRQHGLAELKIGDPLEQFQLLRKARAEAIRLVAKDPRLADRNNALLRRRLLERFPEFEKLMIVG